jgi:hypothetical protein
VRQEARVRARRTVALAAVLAATLSILAGPATAKGRAAVDPTAVPLGDGQLSTSPKVGSLDSCRTSFPSTGGAQAVGPWIDTTNHTWNSTTKVAVQGSVSWPTASYTVTVSGGRRHITTNDLPTGHASGTFPVGASDPAAAYDRNPNHLGTQSISWSLPANPAAASRAGCVTLGPIGVLSDGVLLYDALDGEGRDAVAHEVLDSCAGHPDQSATYHHHDIPPCILNAASGRSTLVGYVTDGYGIYVERDAHGNLVTNADLDACHGRTSTVVWNGKKRKIYHYDATLEYPYTIGCFHGTPISTSQGGGGGGGANRGGPDGGPGGPPGGGPPGGPPPGGP